LGNLGVPKLAQIEAQVLTRHKKTVRLEFEFPVARGSTDSNQLKI